MNDFIARKLNEIKPLNSTIHFRPLRILKYYGLCTSNNNRIEQNNNNTIVECGKDPIIIKQVYQPT